MLSEALIALATATGSGIVQAVGTDVWTTTRDRVARLLGRGRTEEEQLARERLDRTSEDLAAADPRERAALAGRQEIVWQSRLEDFLEQLAPAERDQVAEQLNALLGLAAPTVEPGARVHADNSGVTAGGNVSNQGGVIGRDIDGPVTIGHTDRPTPPGPAPR